MNKIMGNDKLAEMAMSDPKRVKRDLEVCPFVDCGFQMSSEIRAPKKQRLDHHPSSLITSLPDDVIIDILARVPIGKYPELCRVSKHFRSIVSSDELYTRRVLLGCTEACIYAVMYNLKTHNYDWYLLHRNRLVLIQSIPPMLRAFESFVSDGSKIYVLGMTNCQEMTRSGLSINCRSQAVKPPPTGFYVVGLEAAIMDEKIYILGNYNAESTTTTMLVFNTETGMWEPEITKLDMKSDSMGSGFVAMADKIYIRGSNNSFVYKPKESKWETDDMLNSKRWRNACVIDDLLCYYDYYEKELRSYDTKHRLWRVVKGVEELFPEAVYLQAYTLSYGGKLAVFLRVHNMSSNTKQVWCAEIALERRGGEIWGGVEWVDVVIEGNMSLEKTLVVMV